MLLRADMKAKFYRAFACLDVRGPARTEETYASWVQNLATKEFTGELAVLCGALELGIRIEIIPYTPPVGPTQWETSTYGPEGAEHVIRLGNNNVHYMCLPHGA